MATHQDAAEPRRLGVEYRVLGPLSAARADLPLLLRVAVRNTGTAIWSNRGHHPINLSYHWLDAQGQMVIFDGVRASLQGPLRPGESVELELQIEPPPRLGDHLLSLDMVEEGVGWFSLQGVAPLNVPLAVAPGLTSAPRACIISPLCIVNDAVGNHVVNQVRFFLERGYQVLVLLEHIDRHQPVEVRQHMVAISRDDLRAGKETPLTKRALEFFHSADIYIYHYPIFYSLFESITWVDRGVVIVDYHGITPPHLWDGEGREGLVQAQQQLSLVRYADYAIAHSAYAREELLLSARISPERVFTMPYVVPLDMFRPGPRAPELVARHGLEGRPVLLYVGRMSSHKRIIDMVRALPVIDKRYPGTVLLLVGDDRAANYERVVADARTEATRLGSAEQVIFTGPVDHNRLDRFFNTCDVYVTSSLHEGFCIPVIEAMACGKPVVGTHTTALPDTIGSAGLTFQPEDPADLAAKLLTILDSRGDDRPFAAAQDR
jgi:glycosyltransferase involved in cell wall biosynthesis